MFWFGLKLKPRPRIHKSKKLCLSGHSKPCWCCLLILWLRYVKMFIRESIWLVTFSPTPLYTGEYNQGRSYLDCSPLYVLMKVHLIQHKPYDACCFLAVSISCLNFSQIKMCIHLLMHCVTIYIKNKTLFLTFFISCIYPYILFFISCIIEYVMNKRTLNLLRHFVILYCKVRVHLSLVKMVAWRLDS